MRAELIRLQKDLKTTTIYVTHDQVEAMTMGDRIAVMNAGKIMQVGEPMEVFKKPANLFVAGFVGSPPMNFFECSARIEGTNAVLDCGFFEVRLDSQYAEALSRLSGSELVLGIRPHHIKIFKNKEPNTTFDGEVFAVEPLGTETVVDIRVGDNIYKAVTDPYFSARIGDRIYVWLDTDHIHVFDKKSGIAVI